MLMLIMCLISTWFIAIFFVFILEREMPTKDKLWVCAGFGAFLFAICTDIFLIVGGK